MCNFGRSSYTRTTQGCGSFGHWKTAMPTLSSTQLDVSQVKGSPLTQFESKVGISPLSVPANSCFHSCFQFNVRCAWQSEISQQGNVWSLATNAMRQLEIYSLWSLGGNSQATTFLEPFIHGNCLIHCWNLQEPTDNLQAKQKLPMQSHRFFHPQGVTLRFFLNIGHLKGIPSKDIS